MWTRISSGKTYSFIILSVACDTFGDQVMQTCRCPGFWICRVRPFCAGNWEIVGKLFGKNKIKVLIHDKKTQLYVKLFALFVILCCLRVPLQHLPRRRWCRSSHRPFRVLRPLPCSKAGSGSLPAIIRSLFSRVPTGRWAGSTAP